MKARLAVLLLLAAPPGAGVAAEDHFPQPVSVGSVVGQRLIAPIEAQPSLGTIETVERGADGAVAFRVRTASLLPWGARSVSVPAAAISYLGPQLALTGLTEAQFNALPAAAPSSPLPRDEAVPIGLVKPFH